MLYLNVPYSNWDLKLSSRILCNSQAFYGCLFMLEKFLQRTLHVKIAVTIVCCTCCVYIAHKRKVRKDLILYSLFW